MEHLIWAVLCLLILVGFIKYLEFVSPSNFQGSEIEKSFSRLYIKKDSIMNRSEMAFFFELKRQVPDGYHIFSNVRIADIIRAVDGVGFYHRRNRILPKSIDFLICDMYLKPIVAIEVNGSSHYRLDRIARDHLVQKIFKEAQLPIEFVNVGTNFAESIEHIISYLNHPAILY